MKRFITAHAQPAALGAATVLGYAPFYLFPIPLLTLAWLFAALTRAPDARTAAHIGLAFGLGLFGAGVSWVYVSMHDFGFMPAPLAAIATALFCAFLALFPAAIGWLQARCGGSAALRRILLLPALWLLAEWLRGWLFTGFPWLAAGYSQVPFSPLAGYAPLLGGYGVGLTVALSAGLLAQGVGWARSGARRPAAAALAGLALLWGAGFGLQQLPWTQPAGEPVSVSLLQGNVPQDLKWQRENRLLTLSLYGDLVRASPGRLVILPETALPLFWEEVPEDYRAYLAARVRAGGGDVLVGAPERPDGEAYYNSMVSLGASPSQVYRKQHLVPFGEYLPPGFAWVNRILTIPLADFSRGAPDQQPLALAGQKLAVNICYEDAFGEEIIRQLPQATLLANVSNDAWFGDSVAPWQHLQIAQTRALETGRWLLRATNTGVTAIIDERGRIRGRVAQFQVAALHGDAQGRTGATPYVRWGNAAALALAGLLLALAAWLRRRGPAGASARQIG